MTPVHQDGAYQVKERYPLLVGIALAGGAAAYGLPTLAEKVFMIDSLLTLYGWLASTMLFPSILGFLHPRRAFQWGLLVFIGQIALVLIIEGLHDLSHIPAGTLLYGLLLLPAVLCGFLGAFLSRVIGRHSRQP